MNHQGLFPVGHDFVQPAARRGAGRCRARHRARRRRRSACRPPSRPDTPERPQAYQDSLDSEPLLIAAALAAVYLVLGILYESYIHPITILSTLPSAGVGALLALMLTSTDLSIIAMIGIILLIGIVKKNAIMMIDFAIWRRAQRRQELARRHLRSLPAALPAHPDDHHGRDARRAAAGARHRHRVGTAPAAGNHDHRRIDLSARCSRCSPLRWSTSTSTACSTVGRASACGAGRADPNPWGRRHRCERAVRHLAADAPAALALFSSACAVGPNYKRPPAIVPPAYKEAPPDAFKEARRPVCNKRSLPTRLTRENGGRFTATRL